MTKKVALIAKKAPDHDVVSSHAPALESVVTLLYPAFVGALSSASRRAAYGAGVSCVGVSVNGIPYSDVKSPCNGPYDVDTPAVVSADILVASAGYEPQRLTMNIKICPSKAQQLSCSWAVSRKGEDVVLAGGFRQVSLSDITPLEHSLRGTLSATLRRTDVNPYFAGVLAGYLS